MWDTERLDQLEKDIANEATQRGTAIIRLTLRGFKTNSGKVDENKLKKIESKPLSLQRETLCVWVCVCACLFMFVRLHVSGSACHKRNVQVWQTVYTSGCQIVCSCLDQCHFVTVPIASHTRRITEMNN